MACSSSVSHSVVSDPLRPHGLQPARLLCPWDSPGKHTGVRRPSLLQGIFSTRDQTWVSCITGRLSTIYCLYKQKIQLIKSEVKWRESHSVVSDSMRPRGLYRPWNSPGHNTGEGSPSLLQGIFPTQDWTQVSCIAGSFFTSWATREAQEYWSG